jgi:competence protein ComEC
VVRHFELSRWLEHDGDGRTPAEVGKASAFRCDGQGCVAAVKGLRLALVGSAAALRGDCVAAAIVVLKFAKPGGCRPSGVIIDVGDITARGAHALTIRDGRLRVETVADARGNRPWSPAVRRGGDQIEVGD